MKRDMDLARNILFEIERKQEPTLGWHNIKIKGHSDEETSYHIRLLNQAGLVEAINVSGSSGYGWKAKDLTWHGHEFLDIARDPGRWEKCKATLKEKGVEFSLDIARQLLIDLVKRGFTG